MKLIAINLSKVDQKFLMAYLTIREIKPEDLDLYEKGGKNYIGNQRMIKIIREEYAQFQLYNCSIGTYFNREVIIAKISKVHDYCTFNAREITRYPLFMVRNHHNKFFYGHTIQDLKAEYAVRIPPQILLMMYGRPGPLVVADPPSYVETYEMIEGFPVLTENCPGISSDGNPILAAYDQNSIYWLTHREMVRTLHRCQKFPGKCSYQTTDKGNFDRHVLACVDKPKLETNQVIFKIILTSREDVISYATY